MNFSDRIKEIIVDQGYDFTEKSRTIYTTCPICGKGEKFSILKENGACICYRASCTFGKRWFEDWLMLTARISRNDAKKLIFNHKRKMTDYEINIKLDIVKEKEHTQLEPINWPEEGFLDLIHPDAAEGRRYILNRGISTAVAIKYGIKYSPFFRRIIIPIMMEGKCYGWQGRAIDIVNPGDRMRNNTGFRRDSLLMFLDNVKAVKHVILCEGPFDAIKFDAVGGNIASMGKVITQKQIDLINQSGAETVYLGLDEDALKEVVELIGKMNVKVKLLEVPDSCKIRCKSLGKKADFGECTFSECALAFENAREIGPYDLLIKFL